MYLLNVAPRMAEGGVCLVSEAVQKCYPRQFLMKILLYGSYRLGEPDPVFRYGERTFHVLDE